MIHFIAKKTWDEMNEEKTKKKRRKWLKVNINYWCSVQLVSVQFNSRSIGVNSIENWSIEKMKCERWKNQGRTRKFCTLQLNSSSVKMILITIKLLTVENAMILLTFFFSLLIQWFDKFDLMMWRCLYLFFEKSPFKNNSNIQYKFCYFFGHQFYLLFFLFSDFFNKW